jgi:hypothetical protein
MQEAEMRKLSALIVLTGLVGAAPNGALGQTVIYDTLSITDDSLYNRAFGNCIGFPPGATDPFDLQLADDFELKVQTTITRVVADFVSTIPAHAPEAVWVQFFADVGGAPSDEMTADLIAIGDAVTVVDLGLLNTPAPNNNGVRFSVDLSKAGVALGAGTWWVSVQPVDVKAPAWYWILRQLNSVVGFDNFGRNGGTHHKGPFGGFQGVLIEEYNNWAELGAIGFLTGTVPMRIEGSGGCRADFNADGEVNSQDFFDFLNAFFTGLPSADFNGDGSTNSQDFFDFLSEFFVGCPG